MLLSSIKKKNVVVHNGRHEYWLYMKFKIVLYYGKVIKLKTTWWHYKKKRRKKKLFLFLVIFPRRCQKIKLAPRRKQLTPIFPSFFKCHILTYHYCDYWIRKIQLPNQFSMVVLVNITWDVIKSTYTFSSSRCKRAAAAAY